MWFRSALDHLTLDLRAQGRRRRPTASRLLLELLEDRTVPSFLAPVNYVAGQGPAAVTTADFRNDGIQDLAVANFNSNGVSVLLGNGNGTFQPPRSSATGTEPVSLAVGNFFGDGKVDIVTANYSGTLSLLRGNGDGTFQSAVNFALPRESPPGYTGSTPLRQSPLSVAVGDLNHDGKLDLVVVGQTSFGGDAYAAPTFSDYVNVLVGHGDGTFTPASVTLFSGTNMASEGLALADLNGDGNLDVADLTSGGVSVMLGNGDGALAAPTTFATPDQVAPDPLINPGQLAVGDLNGDGKLDLVAASCTAGSVSVLMGYGDGTFQPYAEYGLPGLSPTNYQGIESLPLPQHPEAIVVGDLTGDGKLDLAVTTSSPYTAYSGSGYYGKYYTNEINNNVNILVGNGDGTLTDAEIVPLDSSYFAPPSNVVGDIEPYGLVAGDFNNDGFRDLAVGNVNSNNVSVLLNGANSTPQPSSFAVSGFPSPTAAGASGSFTVTALNVDGSIDTGYTGTVHFTSSGGQAALPGDYTIAAADAGVHTFSAALKTAGTQLLAAKEGSITGSESGITVTSAAASKMIVTGFPSPTTAGVASSFAITLEDPYGNIASGYRGTVHITSSDTRAVLPANYTFTVTDAGTHDFSATLKTASTQSIIAVDTSSANLTGTDGGITVNPAAARAFLITAPTSVQAGTSFSLTLTVEDAYGNVVPTYLGTVHFSSTDTKARLPANYTFTAADKGVHTFSGLVLHKTGTQEITITDTHTSALTASVIIDVL
jgi:hypothetical protein